MLLIAGIAVTLLGFVVSLMSLTLTSSTGTRMIIVVAGIALSLFGIIGLINRHYLSNAIWRKPR